MNVVLRGGATRLPGERALARSVQQRMQPQQ